MEEGVISLFNLGCHEKVSSLTSGDSGRSKEVPILRRRAAQWTPRQLGWGIAFILFVLIGLGYISVFGTSEDRARNSQTGIAMPSPSAGTFNINSDYPSVAVSTLADAERASRDLINHAGHSCDVVMS